jgi:hypothetical protein
MSASLRDSIRALDIGRGVEEARLQLAGAPAGVVVAGSIVALGAVSEQHQRDVLECMLLAQLVANGKADRHRDPKGWYGAYQELLESLGWVVQASTSLSRFFAPGTKFKMATVVTDLFQHKVAEEELSLVTATLGAFQRDATGPAQFVFECPSHAGGIGNFQVGLATEEQGALTLQLGRFAFSTSAHITRLAFDEFPVDSKFLVGFTAASLNEEVYGSIRSAVGAKVASRFNGSVAQLDLDD